MKTTVTAPRGGAGGGTATIVGDVCFFSPHLMKQKAALFVSVKVMQRLRYCAFEGAGPEVWTQELISRLASVAVYHWGPFQTRAIQSQ